MLRETTTENGKVIGLPGNDPRITVFKGIPFAQPPVGKNRWRAPQPCEDWEGVREAGDLCVAILHRFESEDSEFRVPLPEGAWRVCGFYGEPETEVCLKQNSLSAKTGGDYAAVAVLLKRAHGFRP